MNTNSYWDESGLLKARKYERDGNMFSRTMYYELFGGKPILDSFIISRTLLSMFSNGDWAQHPYAIQEQSNIILDKASHDEMTAIFYFASKNHGVLDYYIQQTKVWKYILYPQVFFFLLACKYKWQWAINAAYTQMYFSTENKKRAKNGKWDTDGSLLALLKIATFQNLNLDKPAKDREIHWNIIGNWKYRENLIKEMLSEEIDHPLMDLVNGK